MNDELLQTFRFIQTHTDNGIIAQHCAEWIEKLSPPTPEEDPRQTKMPFAVDKTPAQLAQERDEKELEEAWERIDSDFTREQQCRDEMMGGHL